MITKTQAISNFLRDNAITDLYHRYNHDMECQVNVAKDNGQPITSTNYLGKKWTAWTDGEQTYKTFRIPYNAATTPTYEDKEMSFDLSKHVEAIGMTGWNWKTRQSQWVAFDFDSIANHKAGLSESELTNVLNKVRDIPWVQVRYSSSGKGYHLYVYLKPFIDTTNHHEHAALARSILSKLSAVTCFDFKGKVDVCGGNIWVWHRKMRGTSGFNILVNNLEQLSDVPINWKDHIKVVKGVKKQTVPEFVLPTQEDAFEELCGQHLRVELDVEHKRLIDYLKGKTWWWDAERHMLVTHTTHLLSAHIELKFKGLFSTITTGTTEHNCYLYPLRNGAWVVRRFGQGCQEAPTWNQDKAGWTRCYLNKAADLEVSSRAKGGVDLGEGKGYKFRDAKTALAAAKDLGVEITIPEIVNTRPAVLKEQKDGKLVIEIERASNDNPDAMKEWAEVGKKWRRIVDTSVEGTRDIEIPNCDNFLRHVVTELERANAGWYVNNDGTWQREPLDHVRPLLKSYGFHPSTIEPIVGLCVQKSWREVNKPFEKEYTGNRDWNKRGAKLRFVPNPDTENLKYPSWLKILNHLGKNLDSAMKNNQWAVDNAILTGAHYLKCWIASLFQKPYEPLPYLFLFGPQDCGKSIIHEAISLLMDRGCVQANHALLSQNGFNGELANGVLCYVEEIDLSKAKFAYNKIKDWVTSKTVTIREMNKNAYTIPNTMHFINCANSHTFCPSFSGDTRITMVEVGELDITEVIPKFKFLKMLEVEAPDFLAAILSIELPEPVSRLSIPIITTMQKLNIENENRPIIDIFIKERMHEITGGLEVYGAVYDAFIEWLQPELRHEWPKFRFSKEFPSRFPKGTHHQNVSKIGNISFTKIEPSTPWTLSHRGYLEIQK